VNIRQRLLNNMASLFVLQGANYLLPLITIPYLVRVLGPDNFGRISFAQAFIQYFVVLTDYGFNLSATREVAIRRNDPERLSSLFSAVMVVKTGFMGVGFILLLLIIALVPIFKRDWPLYVIVYLAAVLGNVILPVWLFQGLERMRSMISIIIISRFVGIVLIFAYVRSSGEYLLAAALQSSSLILAGILAFTIIPRIEKLHLVCPTLTELRYVLSDGWHIFLGTASVCLFTNSNVFVLGLITNPTSVGYFSAAEKLVRAVTGLTIPIAQAVYPHIAALASNSRDAAYVFIRRLIRIQGIFTLVLSLLLFLFADPCVTLLFGNQFKASIALVKWMALLPFIIGLNNILGTQVMLNFGMQKIFGRILIVVGILSIGLMIPMTIWLDAEGVAITIFIAEFAQMMTMIVILKRLGILSMIMHGTSSDGSYAR